MFQVLQGCEFAPAACTTRVRCVLFAVLAVLLFLCIMVSGAATLGPLSLVGVNFGVTRVEAVKMMRQTARTT